jgi:hypothetical protein
MATLSTAEKADIAFLIEYQRGNFDTPLDSLVCEHLSRYHAKFGYDSQIVYLEALRDAPHRTLLQSLLAVAS